MDKHTKEMGDHLLNSLAETNRLLRKLTEPQTNAKETDCPKQTTDAESKSTIWTRIFTSSQKAPNPNHQTEKGYDTAIKRWKPRIEFLAVFFAIAYAVVTFCQWVVQIHANDLNRQSMIASQRAYVSMHDVHSRTVTWMVNGAKQQQAQFFIQLENSGNTPATSNNHVIHGQFMDEEPTEQQFESVPYERSAISVGPKLLQGLGPVVKPLVDFGIPDLKGKLASSHQMPQAWTIWGWFIYRDAFPKTNRHITEFCEQLHTIGREQKALLPGQDPEWNFEFVGCANYNCTDEQCTNYEKMISK